MPTVALEPLDSVAITVLVDNAADVLLPDQGPAKRPGLGGRDVLRVPAAFLEGGETFDVPLAEHGFSALVTIEKDGRQRRVLLDAGLTPNGLADNMRRLSLSPKDIEAIVFSHGHFDHTTGLDGLVRAIGGSNLPVIVHPDFWTRRRIVAPGREPFERPASRSSRRASLRSCWTAPSWSPARWSAPPSSRRASSSTRLSATGSGNRTPSSSTTRPW